MNTNDAFKVKIGLAEMLKGGVIMDVTNADQAKIAEDAGAAAVMALERIPGYPQGWRSIPHVRSGNDQENSRKRFHSGHGKMSYRSFCGSSDS